MAGDDRIIEQDVRAGLLKIYAINGDMLAVTEVIDNEFVVCCVAGKNLGNAIPELVKLAKQAACQQIRWHAARPRVIKRIVQSAGLKVITGGIDTRGYTIFTTDINEI